jgi:hypothetical protein
MLRNAAICSRRTPDADIYTHYDLDWVVVNPNMDPHVRAFDVLKQDSAEVAVGYRETSW